MLHKVYHTYTFFDLLFIANEKNDELDVATLFKEYREKKNKELDLMNELKIFPKGQILSELISKIFTEIMRLPEKERLDKIKEFLKFLENYIIKYLLLDLLKIYLYHHFQHHQILDKFFI